MSAASRGRPVLELHLLRHADAGDPGAWDGDDAARPLSGKGVRQAARLGAFLAEQGFAPDVLITSPKVRARQTAEIVAASLGVPVVEDARLAGAFDPADVDAILADAGNVARPVLVGHDPDFSDLLGRLVGSPRVAMKKGAIARVDIRGTVEAGEATLRWLIPPDALASKRG